MRLFRAGDVRTRNILVMAGHEGGIMAFGKDLEEAFAVLMREREGSSTCIKIVLHEGIRARHDG